ncbi:transcription elongation factor Spt5 [Pyrobaculum aerophilum]|uniref:Transcription elongation factor Spt5 n=2 Tax=Pyrobaculum aerophilum TaxID=13773 RepID=Q8ZTT6_PYRAE|nr:MULTISPECIES: transcription elongation factor Spt5 [Pyrobaculum]AAL64673.1 transcription antitermination protein nusG, putative [Pyrobaculum aerophilum str. IM2]MCX8136529.1 transcription elongation factor Spt5 [Pyrobaculum aerophilum]RFA93337.1 transcription elongation factor Spt5 [Pyrobaculum aerophilum]RFA95770.1 transcription elongation factor Spt5 [Pyrobaculum aerophilum]HII46192.1 transcription elongation factor Spt5 [Pyrobaculum aerophilum]
MAQERCPVYTVSVVSRQEYNVVIVLKLRAESAKIPVYSIVVPPESFGVMYIEGESLPAVNRAVYGVKHVKGVMRGITNVEEVMRILRPTKPVVEIDVNDEVEIVADVLKGSRARVTYVDKEKGIVRVELLDSAFPMPLDLKISEVKLVKKSSQ